MGWVFFSPTLGGMDGRTPWGSPDTTVKTFDINNRQTGHYIESLVF